MIGINISLGIGSGYRGKVYASSDVPQSEADALIAFYEATGGNAWTNKTGWGTDPVVNNWHGITVAGGHVTQISLPSNNLVGDAGSTLDPVASSLTLFYFYGNSITDIDVSALTSLTILYCNDNVSLSVLDVSALTSVYNLRLHNCDISTLDVSALTALLYVYCNGNSISVLDIASAVGMRTINAQDNAMSEAEVDQIVQDIYDNWANFTYATPSLNISGTNAAPSGVYQDGDPPTTGKEYIYEIVVDPEATGNEKWAVTYTA